MAQPLALIVDDEPDIRELLELTLSRMAINCVGAADIKAAKEQFKHQSFNLCLTDMRLPDGNGIELVEFIQTHYPSIPTAVITAHGNMESAVNALKAGAFDFVSKPVDLAILRGLIATALRLNGANRRDQSQMDSPILGQSSIMRDLRTQITKLARSQAPVYITGASGSGKELVAQQIHSQGPRADQPFIPVNCGAIPNDLMESEFFGHTKGSFTGAQNSKTGLFQAANGGTLFLDEVADLPLHMQVKLLRAIQERAIRPIGTHQEIPVDVRILSATHKDLSQLVTAGAFRQDLFYRINVIELQVPPLRQRATDIPTLTNFFLQQIAARNNEQVAHIDTEALADLTNYYFPGNVRELENILERAITLCDGKRIRRSDLQLSPKIPQVPEMINSEVNREPTTTSDSPTQLNPYLDNTEKQAIIRALERTQYNKTAAARLLGITFRALRYRLKKYNLS